MKIDIHCPTFPVSKSRSREARRGRRQEKTLFYADIPLPLWESTEKRLAKSRDGHRPAVYRPRWQPKSFGDKATFSLRRWTNDFNASAIRQASEGVFKPLRTSRF